MTVKTANVTAAAQSFPPGTVGGPFRYTVKSGGLNVQTLDSSHLIQAFDLPPGTYTVLVERLEANTGMVLGQAESSPTTIAQTQQVSVDVPTTVTIT